MSKRYLILIFSAFLAMVLSDRTDCKECTNQYAQNVIETICADQSELMSAENPSEYGIPRQNSYSAPLRNLQPAKRTTSSGSSTQGTFAVKTGKSIDVKAVFRTLAYCQSDFSGTYAPERLLISLRKLVI